MTDQAAARRGFTGAGTCSRKHNTGGSLTFSVLKTTHFGSASIGAGTKNKNALITGVTFVMELLIATTTDKGIAGVRSGSRKRNTGTVVRCAFCVLTTSNCLTAFVGTGALNGDALRSLTDTV
jgi:hypothetical protein